MRLKNWLIWQKIVVSRLETLYIHVQIHKDSWNQLCKNVDLTEKMSIHFPLKIVITFPQYENCRILYPVHSKFTVTIFFVENGKRRDFYIVDCLVSMAFRISWESYNYNKFYFISLQLNLFSQTTIHDSVEYHHFC